ncbi:MAG: hypothetical protein LUJ25_01070 [Firmicutes bacterium]|nr:hypothetical protein [Bacillota bacterium]
MYPDDDEMIESLKNHVDTIRRETQCNNKEIAIISFEGKMFQNEIIDKIRQVINASVYVLNERLSLDKNLKSCPKDQVVLSNPYNINGLEFAGVILIGVDDGRVPQTRNVGDVSENYIKFIAFNQLYLSASRAKYRLIILGNEVHGISPCLHYAINCNCLETDL